MVHFLPTQLKLGRWFALCWRVPRCRGALVGLPRPFPRPRAHAVVEVTAEQRSSINGFRLRLRLRLVQRVHKFFVVYLAIAVSVYNRQHLLHLLQREPESKP
jgi:hypothetical protein